MGVSGYSSVLTLGHRYLGELFADPVLIQEKVDGSQFSFALRDDGTVACRSKGVQDIDQTNPAIFARAIETVQALAGQLNPGWVYRAEAVCKPKHNTLAYDRAPTGGLILFDIEPTAEAWGPIIRGEQPYQRFIEIEAGRLGLECVSLFYHGMLTASQVPFYLNQPSLLGGQLVEGVVVKNIFRLGVDKRPLVGKLVRAEFREANGAAWAKPAKASVIAQLVAGLATPARWAKAVQHLRDAGRLLNAMQDMPALLNEVKRDIEEEEGYAIRDALWSAFRKDILHGVCRGLPQWYKEQLTDTGAKDDQSRNVTGAEDVLHDETEEQHADNRPR